MTDYTAHGLILPSRTLPNLSCPTTGIVTTVSRGKSDTKILRLQLGNVARRGVRRTNKIRRKRKRRIGKWR